MIKSIKQWIRNNYIITSIYRIIKERKNDKFRDSILMNGKYLNLSLENQIISSEDHSMYYLIQTEWKTNGFFAIMRTILDACAFADMLGLIPYPYIVHSLYNIKGGYRGTENVFEYYFNPITQIKYEELRNEHNYILLNGLHRKKFLEIYKSNKNTGYEFTREYIEYISRIYAKYFSLRNELEDEFQKSIKEVVKSTKTIGLHFRGTGWSNKLYMHPNPVNIEQCIERINRFDAAKYKQVFVATDNLEALETLKKEFGERIVYYNDVERSTDGTEVQLSSNERYENGYYLGKEVLRDAYTLSQCDVLIAGFSQVSLFAQIQKKARGEDYNHVEIIDNGICLTKTESGSKYRKEIDAKAAEIINQNK